ncbi:MAG: hypothetical protein US76_04595 [Parcubacteria group bacterium GW2011_GWA2_38_13b]|nr:MAG: hypothetical protein US76_04595 [Parcubacteria group bacterium GW2011_GWA2_38_13b]
MNHQDEIKDIISGVLDFFNVDYGIDIEKDESADILIFNIKTPESGLLIGANGDNLNALQSLIKRIVFKKMGDRQEFSFSLDVNDYRKGRIEFIKEMARNFANKAEFTKKPVVLQPMSSFERRIVHLEIIAYGETVITESAGEGCERCVVIKPV